MDFLKRKPKDLDATEADGERDEHDEVEADGAIAENAATARKQKLVMIGVCSVLALAAMWYVMDDTTETIEQATGTGSAVKTTVSTDAMVNRQVADREWMSVYEHQQNDYDKRLAGIEGGGGDQFATLEAQIEALRGENAAMAADGTRVLDAYERENQQLQQQLSQAQSRPSAPGPMAAAAAMGVPSAPGPGVAATPGPRSSNVRLTSFAAASGTASRIDSANGVTTYTDSANYLPPNSMARATVIVGADATTNTRSQSDPLPVVMRITGPARSVFHDGRLLATRVQGCVVNGAAYGDLSSEKVYVKLLRMTCPQPGGRYAVTEVKGFLAYGGKVGIRGRVVSREGSLTTQAFLAGLVSGAGTALNSAFSVPIAAIGGSRGSDRNLPTPSAVDVALRGLGGGAESAGTNLSEYLIERAEQYQPVVEMPTGAQVEVVFLDGTFIRN